MKLEKDIAIEANYTMEQNDSIYGEIVNIKCSDFPAGYSDFTSYLLANHSILFKMAETEYKSEHTNLSRNKSSKELKAELPRRWRHLWSTIVTKLVS